MTYIKIKWYHDFPDDPVLIYGELNVDRWETRVVEVFRDGHMGLASATIETEETGLSERPIPSLAEIAEDSQFEPMEISKEEFEEIWQKATTEH